MVGRPFDSIADDLKRIADAISGAETYEGAADKAHRALSRIADYIEENGLGSSEKLDEIIEDKGVGVKTVKPDEEVLDLTVETADWTAQENFIYYEGSTDVVLEAGALYRVVVDGTEYLTPANQGEEGISLMSRGSEGEDISSIVVADNVIDIFYYVSATPADHTFVVSKANSFTVEFETPEAAVWDLGTVATCYPDVWIYFTPGGEYKVIYDGTEYALTCKADSGDHPYIGNLHLNDDVAEDTGEPFIIMEDTGDIIMQVPADDAGVHSVSVTYTAYDYQQIDEKYIPSSGLQLYGPYMATIHEATSVNANNVSNIALSDLYNGSMQPVDMSQMTQNTKFFFLGFSCNKKDLSVLGASIPNEMNPYPMITCANNTESSVSVNLGDIYIVLYSNTDLPTVS